MRLLTLNTHSRPSQQAKEILTIASYMAREDVDLAAFQEVNQSRNGPTETDSFLNDSGYCPPCGASLPVGRDNFALCLAKALQKCGMDYHWSYLPVKLGYEQYDEGLALFWRGEAKKFHVTELSHTHDYTNWKKRAAFGVLLRDCWFYSVHVSRWDDREEPFLSQWRRLNETIQRDARVFLLGDFNCPSDRRDEGYDRMLADGWLDLFSAAKKQIGFNTAYGNIDGWSDISNRNDTSGINPARGRRIDYVMTNDPRIDVCRAETVFDLARGQMSVSDHCGILCEWRDEGEVKRKNDLDA